MICTDVYYQVMDRLNEHKERFFRTPPPQVIIPRAPRKRRPIADEYALHFYFKELMFEYSKQPNEISAVTVQILLREIADYSLKLQLIYAHLDSLIVQ